MDGRKRRFVVPREAADRDFWRDAAEKPSKVGYHFGPHLIAKTQDLDLSIGGQRAHGFDESSDSVIPARTFHPTKDSIVVISRVAMQGRPSGKSNFVVVYADKGNPVQIVETVRRMHVDENQPPMTVISKKLIDSVSRGPFQPFGNTDNRIVRCQPAQNLFQPAVHVVGQHSLGGMEPPRDTGVMTELCLDRDLELSVVIVHLGKRWQVMHGELQLFFVCFFMAARISWAVGPKWELSHLSSNSLILVSSGNFTSATFRPARSLGSLVSPAVQ